MGLYKKHYTEDDIVKINAQYNIVLGERAPGKSYAIKARALEKSYTAGQPTFILIRRMKEDIRNDNIQQYFADNMRHDGCRGDILTISGGEYNYIHVWQRKIYFANINDDGKIKKGKMAGFVIPLSEDERYKSQEFPTVTDVIYEEFVTNKLYLRNEPNRLQNLISTIARTDEIKVWLIANTISRVCPYFQEWCLTNIPKMREGTIDTYKVDNTLIAVEFAPSVGHKSKMFFGNVAKSIQGGAWDTKVVPHLPDNYNNYEMLYNFLLRHAGFTFNVQLLIDSDGQLLIYVYPFTKQTYSDDIRVITDEFNINRNISNRLHDSRVEQQISSLYLMGKICYATNLCGADFAACVQNMTPNPFSYKNTKNRP